MKLPATVFFDKSGCLLEVIYGTVTDGETAIVQKALLPLLNAAAENAEEPHDEEQAA